MRSEKSISPAEARQAKREQRDADDRLEAQATSAEDAMNKMSFSGFADRLGDLLVKNGKKNWPAIVLLYLLILLPLVSLAFYSSVSARRALTRSVHSQRLDLARFSAATVQEKLNRLSDLGIALASRVRFRELVGAGRWQEAGEILRAIPRDFPFIERYFLADQNGTLMADFPHATGARGNNFVTRDWYRGVSRDWRAYISGVDQPSAPGRKIIAAAAPIRAEDGSPSGVLVLEVALDSLRSWIKDLDPGNHGTILVFDQKGRLAAHPALDLQSEFHDDAVAAAARKALAGGHGVETAAGAESAGAQLFAYAPIAGHGWGVVVAQPAATAYARGDTSLRLSLTTYGLIFLLNCALAYVILSILLRVKRAEESRSRLAAIVEGSDDAILSETLSGEIFTWNHGAERIFGYTEAEACGRSLDFLILSERGADSEKILARIRRGETVERFETESRTKSGATIDLSVTVSPIRDGAGPIVGASVIARDISQQKRLRRELQEKNRTLEQQYHVVREANRLKSEFVANMSHELRTPLNAIIGFTQLMHDERVGPVSAEHKEYLGDILTSGRRLLELINDVLDLAKVESGKMEFHPEPVQLQPLIMGVRSILQSVAASKRLTVAIDISPEVESPVIDPSKLKQVIYNYLSNAFKFTPEGGRISIRVRAEDAAHFRLEVEDTGPGITPERIGELFLEFRQLESGLSKRYQGTGLGLALTKRIVEAQGGRVGVQSTVGQGSLFFAVLPMSAVQSSDTKPGPRSRAGVSGPKVLVVEDNENDLNWLTRVLSQAGYAVDSATSGSEAVAKAQQTLYSAILLDLILPDTLGWDVLRAIRAAAVNQDAPVIAVTVVTEQDTARSFALQDYLPKPVSAAALLASLRRAGVIGNGSGRRILVVDDDPAALKLAEAALESSGYQASCHQSAAAALATAAQRPVDAVVVDLLMPEMDGFQFLDRFRDLANCGDTPVIVWTAKNITTAERARLKIAAHSIALKGQGGIDAVLRELRYHIKQSNEETAQESS
jgi:PAS domain S-box-containing protein